MNKRHSHSKDRDEHLWLYGTHAVLAALANPERRFFRLAMTVQAEHDLDREFPLKPEIMDRRGIDDLLPQGGGGGAVHQGIALLASPLPSAAIEDISDAATVVVLDQATDPRNVGAVLRSAAAFGAGAVIVQDRRAPEITGAMAKAASGALETVPLVRVTNVARALEFLKAAGFWCIGLEAGAPHALPGMDLSGKNALVLGSEGGGLRRLTRDTCDLMASIPLAGSVESLNLSNAAAVALYEISRARHLAAPPSENHGE